MQAYRWHILICTGENCSNGGSQELVQRFASKLRLMGLQAQLARKRAEMNGSACSPEIEQRLELWRQVKITRTGCLEECQDGPMLVIYPGGDWYAHLEPEEVDPIVEEHLLKGCPVARLLHYQLRAETHEALVEARGL